MAELVAAFNQKRRGGGGEEQKKTNCTILQLANVEVGDHTGIKAI